MLAEIENINNEFESHIVGTEELPEILASGNYQVTRYIAENIEENDELDRHYYPGHELWEY